MMDNQFQQSLARYADVAVRVGVNLQPGQDLIVGGDINTALLLREIVRSAYEQGARYVHVFYADEQTTLTRFQLAPRDSFDYAPLYPFQQYATLIDAGAAVLAITSGNPDLLVDQDPTLVAAAEQATAKSRAVYIERVTSGRLNWAIVAAPSSAWAAKMFPELAPADQMAKQWETIFATCRLDRPDPVAAWKQHIADLHKRSDYLNSKRYSALHYTGPGTDLSLGLADGHIWISGSMKSDKGIEFVANLPTEEVFSMPHAARVNGTVRSTKPLNLGGALVEDFSLKFENGRAVQVQARKGEELLRKLIETDTNAARLGEVALVPENSPIARSKMLFYNTLFDENAASHIALGESYRFTMQNGVGMDAEAYAAAGGNSSLVHTDFMIGSAEIDIDGIAADGSREPVMRKGDWAF